MPHLWILEDDEDAIALYRRMFQNGYRTEYFKSIGELRAALGDHRTKPDLLIADLRLPDGEFDRFLSEMRVQIPFAVVSASDDSVLLKECFTQGAHDFFVKPINQNEVLFKIQKIISEQARGREAQKPRFADLMLDTYSQSVSRTGMQPQIQLTQTEYKILALFFRFPERRLNRDEIIQEVWKNESLSPKAFDFHLSKLREKLRELNARIHYQTSHGYSLIQD